MVKHQCTFAPELSGEFLLFLSVGLAHGIL